MLSTMVPSLKDSIVLNGEWAISGAQIISNLTAPVLKEERDNKNDMDNDDKEKQVTTDPHIIYVPICVSVDVYKINPWINLASVLECK